MITTGLARIGNEPMVKYTQAGEPWLGLSLAVNYGQKNDSGMRPTQWIDGTLWGTRAEKLGQYLNKGDQHCFTLQDLHTVEFERKDGTTATKLVARVLDVVLASGSNQDVQAQQQRQQPPQQQRQQPQRQQQPVATSGELMDMDDDIPF